MNTEKLDRKKRYYQKNRSKILNSLKDKRKPSKGESVAFSPGRALQRIAPFFRLSIEKLLLAFLVLSCTCFLVIESARTLQSIEGGAAVLKALLCELVLVGASMLAVSNRRMQILRAAVLAGIATLSLLSTIGGPLTTFSQARQRVTSQSEEIATLRGTIADKQTLLVRYLATNRISGARRLESEIASLSDRLTQVQRELVGQKSEFILALGFGITVLFRLVIMAANAFFANQLGQLLREHPVPKIADTVPMRPKLLLVRT